MNVFRPKPTSDPAVTVFVSHGEIVITHPGGEARIRFADIGLAKAGLERDAASHAAYLQEQLAKERARADSLQRVVERLAHGGVP